MDRRFVVASIEDRLKDWRRKEKAATEAESELRQGGQAASDPRVRDLAVKARQLREEANREFGVILRAVKTDGDDDLL